MYYVIKKQPDLIEQSFIGFQVPKYIAAKNNDHVILEFSVKGKVTRKWVRKEEIILLNDTSNIAFLHLKIMKEFKGVEETQKRLVEEARAKLDESVETFSETMKSEMDKFEEIRNSDDVPNMLRGF